MRVWFTGHKRIALLFAASFALALVTLGALLFVATWLGWFAPHAPIVNGCELKPYTRCNNVSIDSMALGGINLNHAQLSGAQLDGVDLQGANLRAAQFNAASITNVNLNGADLRMARLDNGQIQKVDFRGADLRGALLACNQVGPDSSFYRTHAPNGSIINSYAEWQVRCRGLAFPIIDRERGLTAPNQGADALRVVDKTYGLGRDDEPDDLVPLSLFGLSAEAGSEPFLRYDAAAAFAQLVAAEQHEGYLLLPISGYRSYAAQEALFADYVQSELGGRRADEMATADAVVRANRYSAMAGHSEHQLGTVIDVSTSELSGALDDRFAATDAGKWLAAHADEYGFAFSYPEGKENATGYMWEPWHLRWVGPPVAQALVRAGYLDPGNDLTLAAYLAATNGMYNK